MSTNPNFNIEGIDEGDLVVASYIDDNDVFREYTGRITEARSNALGGYYVRIGMVPVVSTDKDAKLRLIEKRALFPHESRGIGTFWKDPKTFEVFVRLDGPDFGQYADDWSYFRVAPQNMMRNGSCLYLEHHMETIDRLVPYVGS